MKKKIMIFRFNVISDTVENFALHIDADENNTFLELHGVIQKECNYKTSDSSTFFLADEEWDKGSEIKIFENNSTNGTTNKLAIPAAKGIKLGDYLKEREDKLIYVFDVINKKSLYIELNEIVMEKNLKTPVVTYNRGNAPVQSSTNHYDTDLLASEDDELHNAFTDFGELEDLNMIYGEIGEVI